MRTPLAAVILVLATNARADDPPPPTPEATVRARASADATRLGPQRGVGGGDANPIRMAAADFSELAIGAVGCEKMTGYLSLPQGLDRAKRYALMFVFHGNGDRGRARTQVLAQITTARDPVIVVGVQYQALLPDGAGKMGMPLLTDSPATAIAGCGWLLDKIMKEQPVDPARVFVGGFSWGGAWSCGWCESWWRERPDTFPFRALFLYSGNGAPRKETVPPIPVIVTVGELETAAAGGYDILPSLRNFSNVLASWGVPLQHHEIPKMGHDVNYRCLQITRDVINELGGPGALPYPSAAGASLPEPLALAKSDDPVVASVHALVAEDRWADAIARIAAVERDRTVPVASRKAVVALRGELQKLAQTELARLDAVLALAAKAQALPSPFALRRQRALLVAYAKSTWPRKKQHAETVAIFSEAYPPYERERERERAMRDAWALEQAGKRAEAKPLYEALVAREAEDQAQSEWPRAAKYRLGWWVGK